MNGRQLRHYRESHGLSLRELAARLEDVSASTLGRWELDSDAKVPSWVTERLFRRTPITLLLEDLHTLLDEARDQKIPLEKLIFNILKSHARKRIDKEQERVLAARDAQDSLLPPVEDFEIKELSKASLKKAIEKAIKKLNGPDAKSPRVDEVLKMIPSVIEQRRKREFS